ncbi:hypothetical protein P9112_002738 [Eukaryota sp. TZLM1-RC]
MTKPSFSKRSKDGAKPKDKILRTRTKGQTQEVKFDESSRRQYVSVRCRQKAKNERRKKGKAIHQQRIKDEIQAEKNEQREQMKLQLQQFQDHDSCSEDDTVESDDDTSSAMVPVKPPSSKKPIVIKSLPSISNALSLDDISPINQEET